MAEIKKAYENSKNDDDPDKNFGNFLFYHKILLFLILKYDTILPYSHNFKICDIFLIAQFIILI